MEISFTTPAILYLLLLCPAAAALCFWAKRRRQIKGISLIIWKKTLQNNQTQKNRKFLQPEIFAAFLFPALIVFPLSGMQANFFSDKSQTTIFIDISKSMQSLYKERTRLDEAERTALNISRKELNTKILRHDGSSTENLLRNYLVNTNDQLIWISDSAAPINSPRIQNIIIAEPSQNTAILQAVKINKELKIILANFSQRPANVTLKLRGADFSQSKNILLPPESRTAFSTTLSKDKWEKNKGRIELSITPADDLDYDNKLTLNFPLTVAIDARKYPHFSLALQKAAGLTVIPENRATDADILVTDIEPAEFPGMAVILVSPEATQTNNTDFFSARLCQITTEGKNAGLPPISLKNLKNIRIPKKFLQGKILIKAIGTQELPFLTTRIDKKRNISFFYLAALPEKWVTTPGFAVMACWIAANSSPENRTDQEKESNNSQSDKIIQNALKSLKLKKTHRYDYLYALLGIVLLAYILKKELKVEK